MQRIEYLLFLLLFPITLFGQILDDSTKLVYSAKTTLQFTQATVENNLDNKQPIDTSIFHLHNYYFYYKNNTLYQDLGNLGTPMHRIYYAPPSFIGKSVGITTMYEYGYDLNQSLYYDTKSPYTKLHYIQGSKGQQIMEVSHAQNIKPNWNAGFDLKRMVSLKQIGVGQKQEKQVSHYSFIFHTSFFSKNKRYALLANLNILQHQQFENGGIKLDSGETKDDMFDYKLEKVQLYSLPFSTTNKRKLRSYDRRSNSRIYQEYAITKSKSIQLFHQFDYQINTIRYDDDYLYSTVAANRNSNYYPAIYHDSIVSDDRIIFELYENKAGLKGSINKVFYKLSYRRKDFQYLQDTYVAYRSRQSENFVGAQLDYRFNKETQVSFKTEYLLGNDYYAYADFTSKFMEVGYNRIYYTPTLFQLNNYSNNYQWTNNFTNSLSDLVYVKGKIKLGNLKLQPWVSYNNVENLIYNDTLASPKQSIDPIGITSLGLIGKINWRAIYLEDHIRYTKIDGPDIYRVPELFNQARLYLYGPIFKKALLLQIGVDASWKSGYYADAYAPGAQQFHLSDKNNSFNYVDGYLLMDGYINAQIKRALLFLRLTHVNMNLPKAGYVITPYYTGMPRSFEFGIKWLFYD